MEAEETITVRHAPNRHCYELLDGESIIGKTEYVPATGPDDTERIFYHTSAMPTPARAWPQSSPNTHWTTPSLQG